MDMELSGAASSLTGRGSVLPPTFEVVDVEVDNDGVEDSEETGGPISGFVCAIEYADRHGVVTERTIVCRRYELFNGAPRIGAICAQSRRYKLFNCASILEVTDLQTGESLGDGTFFEQFSVGAVLESAHDWNTTRRRKEHIIAGLNVLCFMARCDGHWHDLEADVITDFVCTLWMRKGWEGDPPLDRIAAHARRLAPDGKVLRSAIREYAHSSTSAALLTRFVHRVIAADGVITHAEHEWAEAYAELLLDAERQERANNLSIR